MQVWMTLVLVLQLLSALAMIGLVLVQHGKGADMGASFGGGASGSLFGATGSANFLSRSTAVCATVFFIATLALAFMADNRPAPAAAGGSVLDQAAPTALEPAPATIPGAAPAPAEPATAPTAPAAPAAGDGAAPAPTPAGQIPTR